MAVHRFTMLGSIIVGLTLALMAPSSASLAENLPGWDLAWEDDFNQIDQSVWTLVDTNQPTNNSLQDYLPSQVSTFRGKLVITAEDIPSRGLPYRSGQVISKSEQRYGRWEVRAKLPTTKGQWPAIWLLPDVSQTTWPSGGEIDIMENRGNQPHLTSSAFHYGTNPPYHHEFVYGEQQTAGSGGLVNYHDSYHTYAVDWTPDYLRFYVDGVNHYTVHDEDVGNFLSQNTAPMQLVINNAIGGHFLPNPDDTTVWPQKMEVDWVRVYSSNQATFAASYTNGGFEQEAEGQVGGTLAGWSVFGSEMVDNPNVRTASEAVLEGVSSLKLFGPFDVSPTFSGVQQGITVEAGNEVTASLKSFIRSADSIAGTSNTAILKIEFYDRFGAKFGSDAMLDVEEIIFADGSAQEDVWLDHQISATTPEGAVEARLAIVFSQPNRQGGAVHVDAVQFAIADPAASIGDFNSDGIVDAVDYAVWRASLGQQGAALPADANSDGQIDSQDLAIWRDNYGSTPGSTPSAVPEPRLGVISFVAWITMIAQRYSFPMSHCSPANLPTN